MPVMPLLCVPKQTRQVNGILEYVLECFPGDFRSGFTYCARIKGFCIGKQAAATSEFGKLADLDVQTAILVTGGRRENERDEAREGKPAVTSEIPGRFTKPIRNSLWYEREELSEGGVEVRI